MLLVCFECFIFWYIIDLVMNSEDCIFCKIVRGDIPSSVVFEDDICMAFMDVFPVSEGHCLLIPKKHFVNLIDVNKDVVAHMVQKLTDLTRAVKEVSHLHFHSIPRSKGSNFGFRFPPDYRDSMADRDQLDGIAKSIRELL